MKRVLGTYHDFYVQGMSAVVPLGFELTDLTGEAYITKPKTIKGYRKRIGLRWQGQSAFEHEHHKKFPYELMFEAVKDIDAEFISLQRDEGAEGLPRVGRTSPVKYLGRYPTSCGFLRSGYFFCTSVSHLSAAMGVRLGLLPLSCLTFYMHRRVILALTTIPMKLMRQESFGDWKAPFARIKKSLNEKKQALRRVK